MWIYVVFILSFDSGVPTQSFVLRKNRQLYSGTISISFHLSPWESHAGSLSFIPPSPDAFFRSEFCTCETETGLSVWNPPIFMALLTKALASLPFIREGVRCLATAARSAGATRVVNKNDAASNSLAVADGNDVDVVDTFDLGEETAMVSVGDEDQGIQLVDCRVASYVVRRPWVALQDETALKFRMDMPGIAKEHVKVYLDNIKLVVRGKYPPRDFSIDEDSDVLADNEGTYNAEIILPDNTKKDQIKTELKDGILLVTVPKEVTMIAVE